MDDLSQDVRFADKQSRPQHADEINAIFDQRFAEKTTAQWIAILEPQGILCTEINTYAEAALDPQMQANNMVVDLELRPELPLRTLGTPIRLYRTPATHRTPPPSLGEHNSELLDQFIADLT